MYQFMVDFKMPTLMTERFTSRIPEQRALVDQYFADGKLSSYGVSLENARVWAVFNADSAIEALALVRSLPLTRMMQFDIMPLTFFNVVTTSVPDFSVN
jgi:muconolactone delta-isomerase